MAGAATALGSACSGGSGGRDSGTDGSGRTADAARRPTVLDGPAAESGIDTVVVLMMENRSFDSYFGWLARDEKYVEHGRSKYGRSFTIAGNSFQEFPAADGTAVPTYRRVLAGDADPWRGCGHPDPGHSWTAGRAERDGGFLAPGSGNDALALAYFEAPDLPVYNQLARRFTVCDRWHASVLGPTYPNREYAISAQSGGFKTNYLPTEELGFKWPTIVEPLVRANVTIAEYFTDLPPFLLFGERMNPHLRRIDRFHADAAAGTLPQVSFVSPSFIGGNRTDDHPHGDPRAAQRFVKDAVAAFTSSPHWDRGLLVLTYDEWGGFFDHVRPPKLADDRASTNDVDDFSQAGFRVPTVLVSPFSLPGAVDHTHYDHTTILRFLEWRFLGAPAAGPGKDTDTWFLTKRDRNANNLGRALVTDSKRVDLGFDLDAIEVATPSGPCADDVSSAAFEQAPPTPFELALEQGYFERLGLRV
jgi:phospholipase C